MLSDLNPTVSAISTVLEQEADMDKARQQQCFFKTGPGEYGEGDRFIGVRLPVQRRVAKKCRDALAAELAELLGSEIHEHRQTALLIMVESYKLKKTCEERRRELVQPYLDNLVSVNNWDLVDTIAHYILGPWMLAGRNSANCCTSWPGRKTSGTSASLF